MSLFDLLLILLSGLGVVHGFFFAFFLWFHQKGNFLANRILALLLLVLSFRVGKSVILEFAAESNYKLIFVGLGTLTLIGPLSYFYSRAALKTDFSFKRMHSLHFIPAAIAVIVGFFMNRTIVSSTSVWVFGSMFAVYYLHFIMYLILSWRMVSRFSSSADKNTVQWLRVILAGLFVIWIAYVLNLVEDSVPYIIGPVIYSIVVYPLSFLAIRSGYIDNLSHKKYATTSTSKDEIDAIYEHLKAFVLKDKLYKKSDLSLRGLSSSIKMTPQKISMVINSKSGSNFNDFINQYRIEEVRQMMHDAKFEKDTIASIAFECGFSSLSTFNAAFRKIMQKTPSEYRQALTK